MRRVAQMVDGAENISVVVKHFPAKPPCLEFWTVDVVAIFPGGEEFSTTFPFSHDPTEMLRGSFGRPVVVEVGEVGHSASPTAEEQETEAWFRTAVPDGIYTKEQIRKFRKVTWVPSVPCATKANRRELLDNLVVEAESLLAASPGHRSVEVRAGKVISTVP